MAVVSACIASGGIQGFAASLGTGTSGLGATSRIVGACGSGLRLGYSTVFDAAAPGYVVDRIELTNIPAGCLGKSLTATFYGADGTGRSSVDDILPAAGTTQTIVVDPRSNRIDAGQVDGVSIVIT